MKSAGCEPQEIALSRICSASKHIAAFVFVTAHCPVPCASLMKLLLGLILDIDRSRALFRRRLPLSFRSGAAVGSGIYSS